MFVNFKLMHVHVFLIVRMVWGFSFPPFPSLFLFASSNINVHIQFLVKFPILHSKQTKFTISSLTFSNVAMCLSFDIGSLMMIWYVERES